MNIRKILLLVIGGLFIITGCKVSYSLSGASISPDVKTVSVAYFPNSATMVSPILSSTFTDELQSKFARQTKLIQVREEGDLAFEGEIIGYTSTPTAVTAEEYATKNRLTITVRVRFANRIEPEYSFERNFSAYEEYDGNRMLSDAESELIPAIVEQLVDDIFNAAVSNW